MNELVLAGAYHFAGKTATGKIKAFTDWMPQETGKARLRRAPTRVEIPRRMGLVRSLSCSAPYRTAKLPSETRSSPSTSRVKKANELASRNRQIQCLQTERKVTSEGQCVFKIKNLLEKLQARYTPHHAD